MATSITNSDANSWPGYLASKRGPLWPDYPCLCQWVAMLLISKVLELRVIVDDCKICMGCDCSGICIEIATHYLNSTYLEDNIFKGEWRYFLFFHRYLFIYLKEIEYYVCMYVCTHTYFLYYKHFFVNHICYNFILEYLRFIFNTKISNLYILVLISSKITSSKILLDIWNTSFF